MTDVLGKSVLRLRRISRYTNPSANLDVEKNNELEYGDVWALIFVSNLPEIPFKIFNGP